MRRCHRIKPLDKMNNWKHLCFLSPAFRAAGETKAGKTYEFQCASIVSHRVGENHERCHLSRSSEDAWRTLTLSCLSKSRLVVFVESIYRDVIVALKLPAKVKAGEITVGKFWIGEDNRKGLLHVRHGEDSLLFVSVHNWFEGGLATLASWQGETIAECPESLPVPAKQEEAVHRTRIMAVGILRFLAILKQEELGSLAPTMAGQAFALYRSQFMSHPLYVHDNAEVNKLERAAYRGGRTDCFVAGEQAGDFYKLDVNSMYPSVMVNYPLPTKLLGYFTSNLPIERVKEMGEKRFLIADVTLTTEYEQFPWTGKGRGCYPIGTFRTTLAHGSLMRAVEEGAVRRVHQLALYERGFIFSEYVRALWQKRLDAKQQGNLVMADVYKLLLNSLYGKFGQRERMTLKTRPWNPDDFMSGEHVEEGIIYKQWFAFGKRTIFLTTENPAHDAFFAIAAGVTDYARCRLWDLMMQAGLHNLVYIDTDCLIVNAGGRELLNEEIGYGLGQLKEEGYATRVAIYAPKDYEFGDEVKKKGVGPQATYDPTTGEWEFVGEEGLRGAMVRGRSERGSSFMDGFTTIKIKRKLRRDILGRVVLDNGRTLPIVKDED